MHIKGCSQELLDISFHKNSHLEWWIIKDTAKKIIIGYLVPWF